MRLGLEPLSPRHASTIRHSRAASPRLSTRSPIAVDDDSADDAEPQFPRVQETPALFDRPSLLDLSSNNINNENGNTGIRPQQWEQQSSDTQDKDDVKEPHRNSVPELKPFHHQFGLFFHMDNQSSSKHRSRDSSSRHSIVSSVSKDEQRDMVIATRTSICGKKFDRGELEFGHTQVRLTIWKDKKPQWHGEIKYMHIVRFCFSRVDRPPYILLLQLDNEKNKSDFATFYDPIFAKVCGEHNVKEETISKVYGVVFYFDEAMDYMRCKSMADNNPMLAGLFREQLSESEVRKYTSLDALRMSRYPRRGGTKDNSSCDARSHSYGELMGNGARQALDSVSSVTSFFRPTARSSVLEEVDNPFVVREHDNSKKGRTLNLSGNSSEASPPDSGEEKSPISIDDVGTEKQDCGSGAEGREETVVMLREQAGTETTDHNALTFFPVEQNEEQSETIETKKRAALSWRENERVKRKRIESRRNAELLEYPYDGSDKLGRIAVTLGDVDRLVPGEFLNDNIIDFYLRFLWRHLDSLQQQQMYFFTSHFFSQLNGTNGVHELSTADPDERFARVARWTHKETNLFDKRFLFIPINDSFHWSLAVFCNPGSAIIKKHRKVRRRRVVTDACIFEPRKVVDLVDGNGSSIEGDGRSGALVPDGDEEIEEEELKSCQEDRLTHPPCLLFLDSLRCHRKKKFTKMLRNYLECEYKARFASSTAGSVSKLKTVAGANGTDEQESIITVFDSDSIGLLEPNIPLQRNSSDCGVFLLMYAVSIVRLFPFGVTRGDIESNLTSTLTLDMFSDEHVLEFREYLQQLLFCLQFLEKHGLPEYNVREEGLEHFAID